MHCTGSSNGRVGHEYLINNYYRGTLYFCERKKESRGPPLHARAFARAPTFTRGPGTPLFPLFSPPSPSFLPPFAFRATNLSTYQPTYRPPPPPRSRAPCRHICIFIRECNRRARFSPLVARCRGKNSRKMAERFEADMRSDFLLCSLPPSPRAYPPALHPSRPRAT